jgi:hypothetical protein
MASRERVNACPSSVIRESDHSFIRLHPTHCWCVAVVLIVRAVVCSHSNLRCQIASMPADIRSFFGGGPPKASQGSQSSQKKEDAPAKKAAPKKTGRASRVVDDSDDDEEEEVK